MRSQTYFIADLHLDPAQPTSYQLALDFLSQVRHARALYILGDLFEYWIGDDAGMPMYADVIDALAALKASNCPLTVMLGNRDFLLGEAFAQATHANLVYDDELLVEIGGEPVLLLHGDTLCTDDKPYQAFRQQVRNRDWQNAFLAKSIDERIAYATQLREQSKALSANKVQALMDVNPSQVLSILSSTRCSTMIHGHTHRPDEHVADAESGARRLVVGDWHPNHACYVVNDDTGLQLKTFSGHL